MKSGITTSKNAVKIYNLTFFTLCLHDSCWRQGGATCCGGRGGGALKALFLQLRAVGMVGGSYSDWARVWGYCPGERPAQMHQGQPQAARVGASRCCFVVFGCDMEPWLIAFLCVLIRPMLTIPCSVSCRAPSLVCAELSVHHTLSST